MSPVQSILSFQIKISNHFQHDCGFPQRLEMQMKKEEFDSLASNEDVNIQDLSENHVKRARRTL